MSCRADRKLPGAGLKESYEGLKDTPTYLVRAGNRGRIAELKSHGKEVWTDTVVSATYAAWKKRKPDNPFMDMRSLYGAARGRTVFVCGSGPGVLRGPVKYPSISIAVNRAIKRVDADYWAFGDAKPYREYRDHPHGRTATKIMGAGLGLLFPDVRAYLSEAEGTPMRYKDPRRRPLYWNQQTFSWVVHLAIRMGARRIVCVGCEFSLTPYFDGSLNGKSEDHHRGVMFINRERVSEMFTTDRGQWDERPGEILDASDGFLPVPKVDLKGVLREEESKRAVW